MHSTTLLAAATISTAAVAQVIPSVNVGVIETAIENIIPTSVASRIPHETQAIDDLASFLTSITAQPQFTAAVSALEAAVPPSVLSEIESVPGSFLLEVATGSAANQYFSAVPTAVLNYVASVSESIISILEEDTGLTEVPVGLFPTPTAVPYAYPSGGYYPNAYPSVGYYHPNAYPSGGYYSSNAYPSGGYYSSNAYPSGGYYSSNPVYLASGFTGVNPTGASPSGFGTGVSGSGFPQPTQHGNPPVPTIQPFGSAAAPRKGALGVAGLLAGAAILFVS